MRYTAAVLLGLAKAQSSYYYYYSEYEYYSEYDYSGEEYYYSGEEYYYGSDQGEELPIDAYCFEPETVACDSNYECNEYANDGCNYCVTYIVDGERQDEYQGRVCVHDEWCS